MGRTATLISFCITLFFGLIAYVFSVNGKLQVAVSMKNIPMKFSQSLKMT